MSAISRSKAPVPALLSLREAAASAGVELAGLLALVDAGLLPLARFDEPRVEPGALAALAASRGPKAIGGRSEPSGALSSRGKGGEGRSRPLRVIPPEEFRAFVEEALAA